MSCLLCHRFSRSTWCWSCMADNDTDNNILQPGPNQFAAFCDESDPGHHNQDESCVTSRVIFPDGCHIPQNFSQGASAPKKATSLHLSGNRFAAFCDEQETDDFEFEDDSLLVSLRGSLPKGYVLHQKVWWRGQQPGIVIAPATNHCYDTHLCARFYGELYDVATTCLSNRSWATIGCSRHHNRSTLTPPKSQKHNEKHIWPALKARAMPGNGQLRALNKKAGSATLLQHKTPPRPNDQMKASPCKEHLPLQKQNKRNLQSPPHIDFDTKVSVPSGFKLRAVDGRDARCGWRAFAMKLSMKVPAFVEEALRRARSTNRVPKEVLQRWENTMRDTIPRPMDIEDIWWLAQIFAIEFRDGILVYRECHHDWLRVQGRENIFQDGFFPPSACTVQVAGFGECSAVATVPCVTPEVAKSLASAGKCVVLRNRTLGQTG